jgi:hypothetical protein
MISPCPKPSKRLRKPRQKCDRCRKEFTARALLRPAGSCGKRNRFGSVAKKTASDGYLWDSGLERDLYDWLKIAAIAGAISEPEVKPNYRMVRGAVLVIPDFCATVLRPEMSSYFRGIAPNTVTYFESKGVHTREWKLKMAIWGKGGEGPGPLVVFERGPGKSIVARGTYWPGRGWVKA